jgi:RNA polymerase sigma-70 factor (ECF subfamily)
MGGCGRERRRPVAHPMGMKTALLDAPERPSDAELVRRTRAGDTRAFEAIMRRHNRVLYRTARAILRDDAEAEDAVQEAYLRAYRGLEAFRGEAKLSTWLVRIAANEALMRRRRRPAAEVVPMDATVELEAGGEQGDHMLRQLLERKIDALPDDYRAVFMLRAVEELSVEETAAALGIPEATVRTRLFRARGLLRESLARHVDRSLEDAFAFAGERCDRIVASVLRRIAAGT